MNPLKTPFPAPSFPSVVPVPAPGTKESQALPRFDSRPNPMSGRIRSLVERHPDEALGVLRRWLGERDDR